MSNYEKDNKNIIASNEGAAVAISYLFTLYLKPPHTLACPLLMLEVISFIISNKFFSIISMKKIVLSEAPRPFLKLSVKKKINKYINSSIDIEKIITNVYYLDEIKNFSFSINKNQLGTVVTKSLTSINSFKFHHLMI